MDDKRKAIALILIGVILVVSIFAFNHSVFNLLFNQKHFEEYEIINPEDNQYDLHYVRMDRAKTNFLIVEIVEDGFVQMMDDSEKYTIDILQFDKMDDDDYKLYNGKIAYDKINDCQVVDGVKVYQKPANIGEYAGEDRYYSIIENGDMTVYISTPELNETVKMANSVEFVDWYNLIF